MQYIGERLLNTITCQAPQLCISNVPSISHFSTNSISSWCLTLTQSPCANAMPLLLRIINEKCPQVTRRHWQSAKAGSVFSRRRFMGEAKQSGEKKWSVGCREENGIGGCEGMWCGGLREKGKRRRTEIAVGKPEEKKESTSPTLGC